MSKRARFAARPTLEKLSIHRHSTRYDALRSPTRIREEPKYLYWMMKSFSFTDINKTPGEIMDEAMKGPVISYQKR